MENAIKLFKHKKGINDTMKINGFSSLINSKKGINDISIIAVILSIFLLTAIIIPFVNAEFDTNIDTFDTDNFERNVKNDAESVSTLSAFTVLLTIIKLAFFDFGNTLQLPFWLDAIYTILAILFITVIARNIWVGGGA